MTRIVVIRAGALGDVLLSLPALRALRRRYPDATIDAVGYPDNWQVAGSLVDRIISIDSPMFSGLYTPDGDSRLIEWLRGADLVVAWTVRDPGSALRAADAGEVIWISPLPPPACHAAVWLAQSAMGSDAGAFVRRHWRLELRPEEIREARRLLADLGLERPIILHPGAGAAWKRWPAERFAHVAWQLRSQRREVLLVAGPADEAPVHAVQPTGRPFPVARDLPLRTLAALLSLGDCYLGNDSGITHLAAMAGARTVALFGPTDPALWSPLGPATVLRGCTSTTRQQGKIRVCHDPSCLESIGEETVLRAIV